MTSKFVSLEHLIWTMYTKLVISSCFFLLCIAFIWPIKYNVCLLMLLLRVISVKNSSRRNLSVICTSCVLISNHRTWFLSFENSHAKKILDSKAFFFLFRNASREDLVSKSTQTWIFPHIEAFNFVWTNNKSNKIVIYEGWNSSYLKDKN